MLHLHMAEEGSRQEAHATDVALHPIILCGEVDWSVLLRVACLFHVGYLYIPRDAHHDFHFVRVCPEADAFKEGHKNVESALQPDGVS
jgi:hypothetical protein